MPEAPGAQIPKIPNSPRYDAVRYRLMVSERETDVKLIYVRDRLAFARGRPDLLCFIRIVLLGGDEVDQLGHGLGADAGHFFQILGCLIGSIGDDGRGFAGTNTG